MQKDFYEDHRGSKCPDRLFSKDVRKIKNTLDEAMGKHERDLSLTELQALFFSDNATHYDQRTRHPLRCCLVSCPKKSQ